MGVKTFVKVLGDAHNDLVGSRPFGFCAAVRLRVGFLSAAGRENAQEHPKRQNRCQNFVSHAKYSFHHRPASPGSVCG